MSSDRLLDSILDPLGLLFGSLMAPNLAETALIIHLGAAKSRSRRLFFGPRAAQERSERPPRPLHEAFKRPRGSERPPGSYLGPILPPCWTQPGRKNHPPKACRQLFACQWPGIQLHCKTAVLQAGAGPASGAHAPTRCHEIPPIRALTITLPVDPA